jgi:hypothetical protein
LSIVAISAPWWRRRGKLERFQAKACPGLDPGWKPVRVKKTRQFKNLDCDCAARSSQSLRWHNMAARHLA